MGKYENFKNYWMINPNDSQLFWTLEGEEYDKCDINVLHAITKFEDKGVFLFEQQRPTKKFVMSGLPKTINDTHTPVTADQVRASIGKLQKAGFIEYLSNRQESLYGGKQIKYTVRCKVDLSKIRQHLGEQSTSKLF
jgi:hypothetical protein